MTSPDELTARMSAAIDAVLETGSQTEAAAVAGVSTRSLRRWMGTPAFRAELARRRARQLDAAAGELSRGAAAAARALIAVADGTSKGSTARVAAAKAVIDLASRFADRTELDQRIAALEAALAAGASAPKGTWQQ